MSIERDEVVRIAHLARVAVSEEEIARYALELSNILTLVERINAAATDDVAPLAHPLEMAQRLREDRVTELIDRERFQALAPAAEAGLYLVPRVIE